MDPITTDKYLISLHGCTIVCKYREEPQVRITRIGQTGLIVERKPFREVFRADALPLFTARYSPKDAAFDVDVDCGAQRWEGSQGAAEVRRALVKCGMTRVIAKQFVAEAVKAARGG